MNDLFLKIIAGEIPCDIVYENAEVFAFLDIQPCNKGHVLVVPKVYSRNIFDIDQDTFGALARAVHIIAGAVKRATGAPGVNIIMNNEPEAGQEVFHTHIHIIPRFENDHVFAPAKHTSYGEGERREMAEAIRTYLAH